MSKFFLLALVSSIPFFTDAQSAADVIKVNMKKLQGFVGDWKAKTVFHLRDGKTTTESGTYHVSWTLDSCYQQWNLELQNDSTKKRRYMLILLTFNNDSSRYDLSYFYAGWPIKVFETGTLNNDNEFATSAFIPLEDGKHDEYVRTVTKLITSDKLHYVHFSRFDHEQTERRDFEAELTREK